MQFGATIPTMCHSFTAETLEHIFNILNNGKILLENPLGCPLGCLAEQPALTWAKEKVTKKTQLSWQYSLKSDNSKLTYTFHDFSFSSENDRFPSSHQTVNISYPSYTSKCHAFNTCGNDLMSAVR